MITTRIAFLPLFVALVPVAAAQSVRISDPTSLLNRMVESHAALGPATIRVTLEQMKSGKPVPVGTQTVKRNDRDHYLTEFTEGKVKIQLIASGDSLVTYDANNKAYRRGQSNGTDLALPLSRIRDEVAKGLKVETTSAALGAAKVSRVRLDGEDVYRLDWDQPVQLGTMPLKYLAVSAADGLMRQLLLQDDKAAMRATAKYTPRKEPFPASTFVFTPPRGAKELPPLPKSP